MANLIPLHLDKDTGRLVAKDIVGGGGGGETLPAGLYRTYGYVYTEAFASNIWNITHNFGYDKAIVQIYDTNGEPILPDNIDIVDENQIIVNFTALQEGHAHIIFIAKIE
jgi:hypothetical protein